MGTYSAKKAYKANQETNETNRSIAQETNAANLQLAREENEFNERMWNLTNEYNEPAKQGQRLRAAGLSQAAAAQAVAGVGASPIQSANLSNQEVGNPMVPPPPSVFEGYNLVGVMREIQDLFSQAKDFEIKSKEADAMEPYLRARNDSLYLGNQQKMQALRESYETYPYRAQSIQYDARKKALEIPEKEMNIKLAEQDYKLACQKFSFLEHMNQRQLNEMDARIKNLGKEYDNMVKQGKLIDANIGLTAQQTENLKLEGKVLAQDYISKELDNIFKEFGIDGQSTTTQKIGALVASGKITLGEVGESFGAMRSYLETQGQYFDGSDYLRVFWYKILHEGISQEESLSPAQQTLDAVTRTPGHWKK